MIRISKSKTTFFGPMYAYWVKMTGGNKPGYKENLCHFFWTAILRAPWAWFWRQKLLKTWLRPWSFALIATFVASMFIWPAAYLYLLKNLTRAVAVGIAFVLLCYSVWLLLKSLYKNASPLIKPVLDTKPVKYAAKVAGNTLDGIESFFSKLWWQFTKREVYFSWLRVWMIFWVLLQITAYYFGTNGLSESMAFIWEMFNNSESFWAVIFGLMVIAEVIVVAVVIVIIIMLTASALRDKYVESDASDKISTFSEVVLAWLSAKKRKICPYIEIED